MSRENVKKFMELVKAEESLAKRMVALKDGLQEGEFNFKNDKEFVEKKILPLAKEYGIEFSVEDFVEFTKSQLVELSDEDLSSVSGGLITEFFLSLLAVGGINLAGNAVHAAVSSYFTGGGTSTSTVQSVTDKDEDKPIAGGTEQTAESQQQREIDINVKNTDKDEDKPIAGGTEQTAESQQQREINKNFKKFVSQKKKELKKKLYSDVYLPPVGRQDKIDALVETLGGTTEDGQRITVDYDAINDDLTFRSDKTSQTDTDYDKIRTPLYTAQSTNLAQQYKEAYGGAAAQLTQQYNELNAKLQQKQNEKAGYEATINGLKKSNLTLQQSVEHCYNQLIVFCNYLIQNSSYQYQQWKTALENKTFSNWAELKQIAAGYTIPDGSQQSNCANYVDTLVSNAQQLQNNKSQISQLQFSAGQAQIEIDSINNQMKTIYDQCKQYEAKQQAFNDNLKTEFDYFSDKLFDALKEDNEIGELANNAKTTDDKTTLANKIKEKADQLVQAQFSKQLLTGCSLVVEQQGDSIGIKIVYNGYWVHQSSFSVDEFISNDKHLEIINSDASKKRDEVAKNLAEHMLKHYTKAANSDQLKSSIQSVFTELKYGKLNELKLGIEIVNITNDQVTFAVSSGGKKQNTTLSLERIADEYNKMVKMQAMEATRQQNEGTIEYTPFGRKLWNSIGSQAQHVLDTLTQISNISDVKNREAFENDLKYVANQIAEESRGNVKKMYLAGEHRNDYSFKMEDLQKIKEFASKIGQ